MHKAVIGSYYVSDVPPELIEWLLDPEANIEATSDSGETPPRKVLVSSADPAVVELLLDRGADINAKTPGDETPCQLGENHLMPIAPGVGDRLCGR